MKEEMNTFEMSTRLAFCWGLIAAFALVVLAGYADVIRPGRFYPTPTPTATATPWPTYTPTPTPTRTAISTPRPTNTPPPTPTPSYVEVGFRAHRTIDNVSTNMQAMQFWLVSMFSKTSPVSCVTNGFGICHIQFPDDEYVWTFDYPGCTQYDFSALQYPTGDFYEVYFRCTSLTKGG